MNIFFYRLSHILKKFPKLERLFLDRALRTTLALKLGLAVNMGYAVFKLTTGAFYKSFWFGAIGVYYIMLCSFKFYLLRKGFLFSRPNSRKRELLILRNCGVLLLILNASITAIIYYTIFSGQSFAYPDFIIVLSIFYTAFRIVAAFGDIINFKKLKSPMLSASKALSMSVALMSLFSLQVTALEKFDLGLKVENLLNLTIGSAICISVILIAVTTILRATKALKEKVP